MIELLTTAAGGGLIGLLGSSVSSVVGYFKSRQEHSFAMEQAKLKHESELAMREFDLKESQMELQAMDKRHSFELDKSAVDAERAMITKSYDHDIATVDTQDSMLLKAAEFLRKTTRPILTYILVLLVACVFVTTEDMVLRTYITEGIVTLATGAITWWFADRTVGKRVGTNNG